MKQLLGFILIFSSFAYGQLKQPMVEQVHIQDRVVHGMIDDKYPITMYLRFGNYSDNFLIHSVEGWYYYDNVKKKIPLVGVYTGGLVMYQFESKLQADSILHLTCKKEDPWEQIEELMHRKGFKEKFEMEYIDGLIQGTWTTPKKELKMTLHESDVIIDKVEEYLRVPLEGQPVAVFNLSQIGPVSSKYTLAGSKKVGDQWRVLLKYAIMSSGNPNGMCGAGQEVGYVLLVLDKLGKIVEYDEVVIESCLGNIYSEATAASNKSVQELRVMHEDDPEVLLQVDFLQIQFKQIKTK